MARSTKNVETRDERRWTPALEIREAYNVFDAFCIPTYVTPTDMQNAREWMRRVTEWIEREELRRV